MALIPSARYPSQVDIGDAGYPHGKARNAGSYQDGTGFPLERDWVNDQLGFNQALLGAAGITPSGTPDAVGASQYLEALSALATSIAATKVAELAPQIAADVATPIATEISALRLAIYTFSSPPSSPLPLTQLFERGGFTLEGGNTVRLPSAGTYIALAKAQVTVSSATDPTVMNLHLHSSSSINDGALNDIATHSRNSPHAGQSENLIALSAANITNPALAFSTLRVSAVATSGTVTATGRLFVLRL